MTKTHIPRRSGVGARHVLIPYLGRAIKYHPLSKAAAEARRAAEASK